MTPARFRWGLFLILIGLLLLLQNFDILNPDFWIDLLVLFPVVLIAVGVEKIFARTKLRAISYLTSIALFAGGLGIAFYSSAGGGTSSFWQSSTFIKEYTPDVKEIRAELELDETDLTIRDSGDDLIYARFARFTRKPRISYTISDEANFEFDSRSGSFLGGAIQIHTDESQDWSLRFNEAVPLDLTCRGRESDIHLNMSTTPLRNLDVEADDAKVYLKVGELEPLVSVSIFGSDTELRLRVPRTVGLKILGREYGNYLETIGLTESEDGFTNAGYDTLSNKIEVRLDDRLSSLSIDLF